MKIKLNILAMFESDDAVQDISNILDEGGFEPKITRVDSLKAFKAKLNKSIWNLILADMTPESNHALEAFEIVQKTNLHLPFIIISSVSEEDFAIEAIKSGVNDFILKSRLTRLVPSVHRELKEENIRREKIKAQEKLQANEDLFRKFMAFVPGIVTIKDNEGKYRFINSFTLKTFNWKADDVIGRDDFEIWPEERARFYADIDQDILETGHGKEFNEIIPHDDQEFVFMTHRFPIARNDNITWIGNISLDITEMRRVERRLKDTRQELEDKQEKLEKKDIAMDEILGSIEKGKQRGRDNIIENVEEAILPTIHKLRASSPESREDLLDLLESDMKEITSPFIGTLKHKFSSLTPRELEICRMIKSGLTSKEIANALNLAVNTIHKHREMIRRKLGLTNSELNLNTFLKSTDFS